ncbi:MAG: hypothetical protein AAYR33_07050 [Acetobacteraceae bacterium]
MHAETCQFSGERDAANGAKIMSPSSVPTAKANPSAVAVRAVIGLSNGRSAP